MNKILVLGKRGMAAHMIYTYLLENGHDVDCISIRNKALPDIGVEKYDIVINCVGILVQESEENKDWAVWYNSYLPHFLEETSRDTKTKIIHLSTDCVTDRNFYGRTKALGEIENQKDLTLRMSIIGPDIKPEGIGLFNWFMAQKKEVEGYEYALWNGITTLELAKSIIPASSLVGIYNLVPRKGVSKYDLLRMMNFTFNKKLIVHPVELGHNKMLPPGNKIKLPSYQVMLEEMKQWIINHKELYPHYDV